jgi:hypothetical protein
MCGAGLELQETTTAGRSCKQQQEAQQQAGSSSAPNTSTLNMFDIIALVVIYQHNA